MLSSSNLNVKEMLNIALDCIFPTSEAIEPEILKEITNFLEQQEPQAPTEDAEIVRGEIRKALIHFKNRPYLYNSRKKIESLLLKNENWRKFIIAPHSFKDELIEAGLSSKEIALLRSSLENAENTLNLLKHIPQPY